MRSSKQRLASRKTAFFLALPMFVGFSFVSLGTAMAKDYCFTGFPNSSWDDVGIGFSVPAKGKCKVWTGFNPANGEDDPVSGIGCTSGDGTELSLTLTVSDAIGQFAEIDYATITLSSGTGTGGCEALFSGSEESCGSFTAAGASCPKTPIPPAAMDAHLSATRITGTGRPVR